MTEVIGVKFKKLGKVYYFSPAGKQFPVGEFVVVETAQGVECGEVVTANKAVEDSELTKTLKPVMRIMTEADKKIAELNKTKEKNAFKICSEKIEEHGLNMKLVEVEYSFDGSKILFIFTSENRVDFRELVKELAGIFRTRIELRQVGVRDEAKMLGGVGICGQPFCCSRFLDEFIPVSIKMAKEQGLSLNPAKISGNCGRLMCCLKYEQDVYEELLKITPYEGCIVNTKDGNGTVTDASLLKGVIKVRLDSNPEAAPASYNVSDITILKRAVKRRNKAEAEPKGLE